MQRKQVENPRRQTNQYLGSTLAEPLDLGHISSGVERPSVFAHLLHVAGNEDSPGNVTQPWSHTPANLTQQQHSRSFHGIIFGSTKS